MARSYDKHFKEEALKLSDEIGAKKAADQLGIPYNTVTTWRCKRKKYGDQAFVGSGHKQLPASEQERRILELEKEVKELQRANDILHMTQEQYKLKMKDLIDNWQQRNGTVKTVQHKREVELLIDHTQNFICDGVVCPEKWFSQSIRPLYLLKEAYGEGSWDLIADHLCKSGQISQMWRRVSKWTSGLLGTTENTLMPYGNWGDVDHYGNEYLQKIAIVNVKKSGGKSSSNMDEIRAYAQFDREELLRELELCDPTVIVCGYTASVLDIIFKTSVRKDRNENLFYHIQLNGHDVLVLDYWHPANQYPDVMNYYGLMSIYQQALLAEKRRVRL